MYVVLLNTQLGTVISFHKVNQYLLKTKLLNNNQLKLFDNNSQI